MKLLISFFLILFTVVVYAQNPSTTKLQWSITNGLDLNSQSQFSYVGSMITKGSDPVEWNQKTLSSAFTVTSIDGTWNDVSNQGQMVFHVVQDGAAGTLTFERTAGGIYVTMEFPKDDPSGSWIKFSVSEIVIQN